ncbi:MAG: GldG family protein [Deltaproteobacteria bacterium]|nr:GldG family protein [Deltaproteobacteria bacterium]
MKKKTLDPFVLGAFVVGSLVLLNVLGISIFGRLDLTREGRFSLSRATLDSLADLEDPLTIRAYFTADLPPPANNLNRDVKDLLDAYHAASKGKIRYEFIDPLAQETDEDKEKKKEVKVDIFGRALREATSVEQELMAQGIRATEVPVIENDEPSSRRAYRALALSYGEQKEVLPQVPQIEGLEYELTTLIRKMARKDAPKIALLGGHQGASPAAGLSRLASLLDEMYELAELDLTTTPEIPADIAAIIVAGPKTPLSDAEQRALDQFIMQGKSVAFLLGEVDPELQQLQPNPLDHGLTAMLEKYGVRVEKGLVIDAECAPMSVAQQRGAMMIQQQVRYPFIPVPRALDPDHPLTQGLAQVVFPFMSPLSVLPGLPEGVKAEVLVKSSEKSWVRSAPYDLNPLQRWGSADLGEGSEQALIVALSGAIPSAFVGEGAELQSQDPAAPAPLSRAANARVLVSGGHLIVKDDYLSRSNQVFALNLVDWLAQDDALLAVRSRGLSAAPLDKVSSGQRAAAKYLNILGLPLLFVGFGVVRWRLREARRARATL